MKYAVTRFSCYERSVHYQLCLPIETPYRKVSRKFRKRPLLTLTLFSIRRLSSTEFLSVQPKMCSNLVISFQIYHLFGEMNPLFVDLSGDVIIHKGRPNWKAEFARIKAILNYWEMTSAWRRSCIFSKFVE